MALRTYDCIIAGAAGRDFHDFLTFCRDDPRFRVRCFTATQIPFIDARKFPASLAGDAYDEDIPIHPESELPRLIEELGIDIVFFSYSDLSHEELMHKCAIVQAAGASFMLLGPKATALESKLPVISVTAARTGAGKSPLSQAIAKRLESKGVRVGVLRHPMPYGDLAKQAVQRFATVEDLDRHECTIEEREEYEPYVEMGLKVYAGVDYRAILELAESENDVILWDGGNNDTSFIHAGLSIVVLDALRAGHEVRYYPGETNLRRADIAVVNKVDGASVEAVDAVRRNAARCAPDAAIVEAALAVTVDEPGLVEGKRAVVVEDGPTLTHGGMASGAGMIAALRFGADIADPREGAVGTIRAAYDKYPHLGAVLPALGYSRTQMDELAKTIEASGAEVVIDASPASLKGLIEIDVPIARVRYSFEQRSGDDIFEAIDAFLAK